MHTDVHGDRIDVVFLCSTQTPAAQELKRARTENRGRHRGFLNEPLEGRKIVGLTFVLFGWKVKAKSEARN